MSYESYTPAAVAAPAAPVVVDSPLPNSVTPDTGGGAVTSPLVEGAAPASAVTPPPADAWKNDFQERFSIPGTEFATQEAALQAARELASNFERMGYGSPDPFGTSQASPPQAGPFVPLQSNHPAWQQPQPQQQLPSTAGGAEIPLPDLTGVDPALAAAFKALHAQSQAAHQQVAALQQHYQTQQTQSHQQMVTNLANRAAAVVDQLALPKYGVGTNRSLTQQLATQGLANRVKTIVAGILNSPTPGWNPTIEQVVNLALAADGINPFAAKPAVPAQAAALVQQPVTGAAAAPAGPKGWKDPSDPLGIKSDPTFRAGVKAIFAHHK